MNHYLYAHLPTWLIRCGIRLLLQQRLRECDKSHQANPLHTTHVINQLRNSPIALSTATANEQHYEVPTEFYQYILGPHLKYSAGYWTESTTDLAQAEEKMLALYCERLAITSGDNVLDLGCGWGSASLYIAQHYPECQVTAVSNSATQGDYILSTAKQRQLTNIHFQKMDANNLAFKQSFDKIISIEMFEHMRNYGALLACLHQYIKPEGLLFVHYFCHKEYVYPFTTDEKQSWMAKHFFTDGLMPCENILNHFQDEFTVINNWRVNGLHYYRTCMAWLDNLHTHRPAILKLFSQQDCYSAQYLWKNWQIFILACAELFKTHQGNEWFVCHQLLKAK